MKSVRIELVEMRPQWARASTGSARTVLGDPSFPNAPWSHGFTAFSIIASVFFVNGGSMPKVRRGSHQPAR